MSPTLVEARAENEMLVRKLAEMEEKLTKRQARAKVKEEPETILSENSARACIFPIKYEKVWKMVSTVFRLAIPALISAAARPLATAVATCTVDLSCASCPTHLSVVTVQAS